MATHRIAHRAVWRGALPELAVGGYLLLLGALFVAPFLLSPAPQQNDVFMGNLFLGPLFYILGSALVAMSLTGLGLNRWVALALALIALIALAAVTGLVTIAAALDGVTVMTLIVVVGALVVLGASALVAGWSHHWRTWAEGVALALGGSGAIWLVSYLFGSRYYAFDETVSSLPPYLDLTVLVVSLALIPVIILAALALASRQS